MPDKFYIRKQQKAGQFRPVMLNESTYTALMQLKEITGMTIGNIAESAIRFALERLEIIEED